MTSLHNVLANIQGFSQCSLLPQEVLLKCLVFLHLFHNACLVIWQWAFVTQLSLSRGQPCDQIMCFLLEVISLEGNRIVLMWEDHFPFFFFFFFSMGFVALTRIFHSLSPSLGEVDEHCSFWGKSSDLPYAELGFHT